MSPRAASLSALQAARQWLHGASLSLRELGKTPGDWLGDLFDSGEAGGSGSVTEVWSASSSDWALLAASIVACMALDFFAFRKAPSSAPPGAQSDHDAAEATEEKLARPHGQAAPPLGADSPEPEPENAERSTSSGSKTKEDLFALLCWILCGMAFNGVIFWKRGAEAGVNWCCGYVLEWLLSFDNIFVFYLIFQTYKVPRELLHKALFIGIAGAVVMRIVFFVALSQLLHVVHWVRFMFGVILIYSGVQAAREEDDDADPADSMAMRAFQALFGDRVRSVYDIQGKRLFVTEGQRTYATMLVPVIFCLEATDVVFAIDSVSAKVAQIPDVYIAFSSSAMAIFGLRAMFFVVQDLVDMFDLLKYGLCFILVFIGVELLVSDFVHLPIHVVLVVILSVFVVCIFGPATKRALIPAGSPSDARLTHSG
jgi:tellurite resistance protein TerC